MPPEELAKEIHELRIEFSEKYTAKAALKPPVHLTLIPPYFAFPETEEAIIPAFENWASEQAAFSLELKNFNVFKGNGVVFIDIEKNKQLRQFHKELYVQYGEFFEPKRKYSFSHPHITIGYRDIPKTLFPQAMEEYLGRAFEATFPVNSFYLWKHNRKFWEVQHEFRLNTKSE
jgi:2'-5' RNA ligase